MDIKALQHKKRLLALWGESVNRFIDSISTPQEEVIGFYPQGDNFWLLVSSDRVAAFDLGSHNLNELGDMNPEDRPEIRPLEQLDVAKISLDYEQPKAKGSGTVSFFIDYEGSEKVIKIRADVTASLASALELATSDNETPAIENPNGHFRGLEDRRDEPTKNFESIQRYLQEPANEKESKVFVAMLPSFEAAVEYSAQGDWQNEVLKLKEALSTANSLAFFRGESWFLSVREKLMQAGLIFRGADFIAQIVAESGLELVNRKQQLLAMRPSDTVSSIDIWSDRIVAGNHVVAVDEFTSASVFVDGVDQITQRPTLTRMALLSPLPGSALIAGLALQKKTRNDLRDARFTVSSADWQFSCGISPSAIQFAKSAAERVNAIAARLERDSSRSYKRADSPNSLAEEISKLGELLQQGVLTQDEFDGLKAKLIANA